MSSSAVGSNSSLDSACAGICSGEESERPHVLKRTRGRCLEPEARNPKSFNVIFCCAGLNPPVTSSNPSASTVRVNGRPRTLGVASPSSAVVVRAHEGFEGASAVPSAPAGFPPSALSALLVHSELMCPGLKHLRHLRCSRGTSGWGQLRHPCRLPAQ